MARILLAKQANHSRMALVGVVEVERKVQGLACMVVAGVGLERKAEVLAGKAEVLALHKALEQEQEQGHKRLGALLG